MGKRHAIAYLLLLAIFVGMAAAYLIRRERRRHRRRRRHQAPQQINLFVKPEPGEGSEPAAEAGPAPGSQPPPTVL